MNLKTGNPLFSSVLASVLICSLVYPYVSVDDAQADSATSTTSVTVSNATPVISAVTINASAAITLTENTTKNVVVKATVTDNNGCEEITTGSGTISAVLYRSGATNGAACTASNNDCYPVTLTVDTGTCSGASDTSFDVTGSADLKHYADPTDAGSAHAAETWKTTVSAFDGNATGTGDATVELNTLSALDISGNIAYGSLGVGTNSGSTPQTVVVTNTGNVAMDPQVSSSAAMNCTVGTIPVANQKYSATTFTYTSGGTALSATPTTLNLTLPKQTTASAVTSTSYWGIGIPASGVSGTCGGSNTFAAGTAV